MIAAGFLARQHNIPGVVLAKARTHYHRPQFGEDRRTPRITDRFRGMGPGFRLDDK